jgi:quinol---cytochrome c reductase iron-sulfur subunit, bacillus type
MPGDNASESMDLAAREAESPSRRRFLARLFWAGMAVVSAGIAASVLSYLIGPLLRGGGRVRWVRLGKLDDLPLNIPQRLEVSQRQVAGWVTEDSQVTAWVVRLPDKLYVFDPHCTHLGCAYRWDPQAKDFFCPCHSGVFGITGNVISGPPPRPLDTYAYEVREGFVYVVPTPIERVV